MDWKERQIQQAKDTLGEEIQKHLDFEKKTQNEMRDAESQFQNYMQQQQHKLTQSVLQRERLQGKLEGKIEGLSAVEDAEQVTETVE